MSFREIGRAGLRVVNTGLREARPAMGPATAFGGGLVGALLLGGATAWLSARGVEALFRHAAMFLQLTGLVVLVLELTKTRTLFDLPTLGGVVRGYLARVWAARLEPRAVRMEARAAFSTSGLGSAVLAASAVVSDDDLAAE